LQESLNEVALTVLENTGATAISFRLRLLFDKTAATLEDLFTTTDGHAALHSSYLPPQDTLTAWVHRLKRQHPQLGSLKLVVEWSPSTIDPASLRDDNRMLIFEYREAEELRVVVEPSCNAVNMGLPDPEPDLHGQHFGYTVFPDAVDACYIRLAKDIINRQAQRLEALAQVAAAVVEVDSD
jgi:hypothetical protein